MSETKEIKQDSPATKDVGDTVVVSPTKTGETTYKLLDRYDKVEDWKYQGQLNDEDSPHGEGTISCGVYSVTMKWNNGEPIVGCDISFIHSNDIKFRGQLIESIQFDSKHRVFRSWTMKGVALFDKLSASYSGIIKDMKFYEGVFKTETLTLQFRRENSKFINGKFQDPIHHIIVTNSYSGITFYKIGIRLFYNRDGVTYVSALKNSAFLEHLDATGTVMDLCRIDSPLVQNMFRFSMDDYVSDEELTRLAGF